MRAKDLRQLLAEIILKETIYLRHYEALVLSNKSMAEIQKPGWLKVMVPQLGWFTEAESQWVPPREYNRLVIPKEEDWVEVYFVNGDPSRPVWIGRCQELAEQTPKNAGKLPTEHLLFESPKGVGKDTFDDLLKKRVIGDMLEKAAARKDDKTTIDGTTDTAWQTWWTGFQAQMSIFLTALAPPALPAKAAALLAWMTANPHPSSYTGKISEGSDQVFIGMKK